VRASLRPLPRLRVRSLAASAAASVVIVALAVAVAGGGMRRRGLVEQLSRLSLPRTTAARLSIDRIYRPCALTVPAEGTIPVASCGAGPLDGLEDVPAPSPRVAATPADRLHGTALEELKWRPGEEAPIRRAIGSLRSAAVLEGDSAALQTDLAAAELSRAGLRQSPLDLLEAADAADSALALDAHDRAAAFNLALALDWLAADSQAAGAWRAYLRIDSTSGWAGEARSRVAALAAPSSIPAPPAPGAPGAVVSRFVAADPQAALLLGWDSLLPAWGRSVEQGRPDAAEPFLRLAGTIGQALERRGGDATLADAVGAIRAAGTEPRRLRDLARAHAAYGRARAMYENAEYTRADSLLGQAANLPGQSPSLRDWTAVFHSATRAYVSDSTAALAIIDGVLGRADVRRTPALVGRAAWVRGTVLSKMRHARAAMDAYLRAREVFERIGEVENRWTMEYRIGETWHDMGDMPAAYRSLHRALLGLRPFRSSRWRKNSLDLLATAALKDGLYRIALRLSEESVAASRSAGRPAYIAESLLTQARVREARGDSLGARRNVVDAQHEMSSVSDAMPVGFLRAELHLSAAVLTDDRDSRRYAARLDTAVAGLTLYPGLVQPALIARADARLRLGRLDEAVADLDSVLLMVHAQRARSRGSAGLAPADDPSRVLGMVVVRLVEQHRIAGALALLERERAVLAVAGSHHPRRLSRVPTLPAGRMALRLTLVGNDLLAWAVAGRSIQFVRTRLRPGELERTVTRARSALERDSAGGAKPDLARLYDWLVRPLEGSLGDEGMPVAVMADGVLAQVPFAALFDARTRRYLVERHPVRLAESILDASGAVGPLGPVTGPVLLVADPAVDRAANPGLDSLPGARAEADALRVIYPRATLLAGPNATPEALLGSLAGASLVNFGGHAVADESSPEHSYLVLAPGAPPRRDGRLSAAALDSLKMQGVRLVVLGACESLDAGRGAARGFAGLSGALLGAGVQGVVGTLWPVDDEATRTFMIAFHRAYAATGDAAGALRSAQLVMLRSPSPSLRSPAAWAAFQYAGR
jgi:CHAT domain-containing protein/tetratricopeptide (TPR) repeat protein